ncbi:MAG TPA: MFS transporter [Candidatus Aquilonibacter sp.]|nr:MFS transporter [Candidatus Aquilonibacter sp.]
MAFLLGAGVVVTYFDRINLSVSRDALNATFGLSLVGYGYLSSAFSWTYGPMQVPAGMLLDRFGIKRVNRAGTFLWSCATFAAALSTSIYALFGARLLLGVAESPIFPANAKAIGEWFPQKERSFPMAITDGAAKFSSAIGVPFIGLLLIHFGWRWSFAATGFISFAYFLLFYLIYRSPAEDRRLSPQELSYISKGEDTSKGRAGSVDVFTTPELMCKRKVWGLALGWGAYNYSFYLLLTWLPSYLSIALHLDLLHSVVYTSIPWLLATLADVFIGGWFIDFLIRLGWQANRVRKTAMVLGMSLGLAIWGARGVHSPAGALFWITIGLCGLSIAAPVAWTVPSLIVPQENVGVVGAFANFFSQVAGFCAPIVTGYIIALTHSFSAAFATATVVLLVGIGGYVFLLQEISQIPARQEAL